MLTRAYAVPLAFLKDFRWGSPLEIAFAYRADRALVWKSSQETRVEYYEFDKAYEDLIAVFNYCGFRSVATKLGTGKWITKTDGDSWVITPSAVKSIATTLEKVSEAGLYKKWEKVRNKYKKERNQDLGSLDKYLLPNIESMKIFFKQASDDGNYVVFNQGL